MTKEEYTVILLHATSHVIRAEKLLKQSGIPSKLIPVPRQLSSNCGVCVRVARSDREMAQAALEAAGLELDGVHDV